MYTYMYNNVDKSRVGHISQFHVEGSLPSISIRLAYYYNSMYNKDFNGFLIVACLPFSSYSGCPGTYPSFKVLHSPVNSYFLPSYPYDFVIDYVPTRQVIVTSFATTWIMKHNNWSIAKFCPDFGVAPFQIYLPSTVTVSASHFVEAYFAKIPKRIRILMCIYAPLRQPRMFSFCAVCFHFHPDVYALQA